jgi:leucyl-tRNA---protein transferase
MAKRNLLKSNYGPCQIPYFASTKPYHVLVEYYFPQSLSPARLDRYLAGGWFRSGPSLFRAKMLCLGGSLYSVVNIRVALEEYHFSRSLRRVLNRGEARFRVEIGPAQVDEQREGMYRQHKRRFKGFIFETLDEFLFGGMSRFLFDTQEIAIYDEDQLVAVSYFDQGQASLASLLGLYQGGYQRYSLGLFTMLHEIQYARTMGLRYFYPGYILQGYPGFDYKLRLGHIQYYNWQGRWRPQERLDQETFVRQVLEQRIATAAAALQHAQISYRKMIYPFFSVGYLGMMEEDFVRGALCLELWPEQTQNETTWLLEYVMEDRLYQISWVREDHDYAELMDANFSADFYFSQDERPGLLVREKVLYRHRSPEGIINHLRRTVPSG